MPRRAVTPTMVSREGFETWFDYQVGLVVLAVVAVVLYWTGRTLLDLAGRAASAVTASPLVVAALCVAALVPLLWITRRLGE